MDAVREYTEDVAKAVQAEAGRTADLVLEDVQAMAPERTGEYKKTFKRTHRKLKDGSEYVIWNPKHYRRVHLLEKGHAKAGGGRVEAKPHMGPALAKHEGPYVARIQKIIESGGS